MANRKMQKEGTLIRKKLVVGFTVWGLLVGFWALATKRPKGRPWLSTARTTLVPLATAGKAYGVAPLFRCHEGGV